MTKSRNRKLIRVTLSNERLEIKCVDLSDYNIYLNQIWYRAQAPHYSSSRMRVINYNWSATKQRPHPQSVAEISRHSVLSGDRI